MGRGSNVQVWKFYSIEDGRLKKNRRECPRCGRGVFMAEHNDRVTCGKCGYTEFKRKEASQKAERGKK
jgi:small subunit ribosomal protein S27Ae